MPLYNPGLYGLPNVPSPFPILWLTNPELVTGKETVPQRQGDAVPFSGPIWAVFRTFDESVRNVAKLVVVTGLGHEPPGGVWFAFFEGMLHEGRSFSLRVALGPGDRGLYVSFEQIDDFSARVTNPAVESRPGVYRGGVKRALDILLVLLAVPFVLPVVLMIAVLVMRDGHSPFYWSERVGRGGRVFRMMKLRTMVPDAHGSLEASLAADPKAAAEWAETQKLKVDPRITPFGRVLRKTSLDELPQLWNVLKGEMSLVGPRPKMPEQRKIYPGSVYYRLRPGVTGPWQVSDRNDSSFAKRADFDLDYANTLSFRNDLRLMGRTLFVVLRGTGY